MLATYNISNSNNTKETLIEKTSLKSKQSE